MSKKTILSKKISSILFLSALLSGVVSLSPIYAANLTPEEKVSITNGEPSQEPMSIGELNIPPLVMLVMGREHNIFSEAYPDYTDIDGDGQLDIMYDPSITYEGLFESDLCYVYEDGTANISNPNNGNDDNQKPKGVWVPNNQATTKTAALRIWNNQARTVNVCTNSNEWLGNFMNYATTSRLDALKRVLYGGSRLYNDTKPFKTSKPSRYTKDGDRATILKHTHVLRDAHAWGKVLGDRMYDGSFTVNDFTGLTNTGSNTSKAWFFAIASKDGSRGSSFYFRYGLVSNAGMPGVTNPDAKNYIWHWVSLQSTGEEGKTAIGSSSIGKKDNSNESLFDFGTFGEKDVLIASCTKKFHPGDHCRTYGDKSDPYYQPFGVLQKYGEGAEPSMKFGLISGSWESNTKGAALRANVGILAKEINVNGDLANGYYPGDFDFRSTCGNKNCHGIINTLDRFAIQKKDNGTNGVYSGCDRKADYLPSVGTSTFKCNDWGNPLGKLLYGAAMYFKGEFQGIGTDESTLDIGRDAYSKPYNNASSSIKYCAKPNTLLIADENVSFDSSSYTGDTKPFGDNTSTIEDEVKAISSEPGAQFITKHKYFAGRVAGTELGLYDYLPTLKEIESLDQIVGIAPTAAYSFGSYNMAGVASVYNKKLVTAVDPNNADNKQDHVMKTYVVAMKPNMPEIKIHIDGDRYVTLLPFAKTPEENYEKIEDKVMKNSTNQVADFYVEKLTDTEGVFRINYEDFQYGSDYDMDAVIGYKYEVITGKSGDKYIRIQLSNVEADGYASQSAGYVIAGVEHEGAYIDLAKYNSNVYGIKLDIDNIVNDYFLMGNCAPSSYSDASSYSNAFSYSDAFNTCGKYGKGPINEASYQAELKADNIDDYFYKAIDNVNSKLGTMYYLPRYEISKMLQNDSNAKAKADAYYLVGKKDRNDASNQVSSRVFRVASTTSDVWLHSPLWYAAKFGLDQEQRSKIGDPSNYFLASNPAMLRTGITQMLEQIHSSSHSGSSFSTQKKATSSDDYAYATLYDPALWWGDVRNAKIDDAVGDNEGGYNYDSFDEAWSLRNAFEEVDKSDVYNSKAPDSRNIVTTDIKTGKIHRLYAGELAATSKANSGESTFAFKQINQDIADAIMGTYNHDNPNHRLYLNRLVRWLAGDHTYEHDGAVEAPDAKEMNLEFNDNMPLRERLVTKEGSQDERFTLGDIINSDVKVFSDDLPGKNDGNRILVVGANDGMIHFAKITVNASGKEEEITPILSYVPTPALGSLKYLVEQNYNKNHKAFVDSTPQVYKDNNNVIVYGTYGLGLKGAYAFNVHEIGSKIAPKMGSSALTTALNNMNFLLWELTDEANYAGKMREAPVLAYKVNNANNTKQPYLIFSSGYKAKKAGIFVVDLLATNTENNSECLAGGIYDNGTKPKKSPCIVSQIPIKDLVNSTEDNVSDKDPWGLDRENVPTRVTLVDVNGNDNYQAMYWADNFGWVWKVSLDHKDILSKPACWGGFANCTVTLDDQEKAEHNNFKPKKIFAAVDSNGTAQPITVKPAVGYHKYGGIGLVIGTGSYWETYDGQEVSLKYNTTQSVYMIRDLADNKGVNASNPSVTIKRCNTSPADGEKCLQKLDAQLTKLNPQDANPTRVFKPKDDPNSADYSYGWYLDLYTPINGVLKAGTGERIYRNIIVTGDQVYIVSNKPDVTNSCSGGGDSYVIRGSLFGGNFTQIAEYQALAGDPVLNVYTDAEGNIKTILQVPLDDTTSKLSGVKSVPIETSDPTVKSSSWLRLY